MDSNVAKASAVNVLAAGLAVTRLSVVHNAQQLDREGKIVFAPRNAAICRAGAARYQDELQFGVTASAQHQPIQNKDGQRSSAAGGASLRALTDDNSGITAAFVKGGLIGSLQGRLATEKAKGRHAEYAKLRSLGRLFYEPIWVFTRGDMPISTLRDLERQES